MEEEIKHISGAAGGFLVGRSHANNGIKAINKATGQPLEMEGGEVVITKTAVEDEELREFEGEMLTNRQILSKINESGGGVSFALGGDIPTELYFDEKEYSYGGEKLPGHVIAYKISSCGCNHEPQNGLSKGKTIEDIAAMHNVSVSHIENQIEKGIQVEAEHTSNPQEQVKIAMDHLVENPNYYDILAEAHLEKGGELESKFLRIEKLILQELKKRGLQKEYRITSKSKTDYGESWYIKFENGLEIRISDHSVQSMFRVFDEKYVDFINVYDIYEPEMAVFTVDRYVQKSEELEKENQKIKLAESKLQNRIDYIKEKSQTFFSKLKNENKGVFFHGFTRISPSNFSVKYPNSELIFPIETKGGYEYYYVAPNNNYSMKGLPPKYFNFLVDNGIIQAEKVEEKITYAHGGNLKKGAEIEDLDNVVQVSDEVLDAPNIIPEQATLFAEGGQVINPIVEEWDDVPANYKNTNKVKKVNFANNPIDKGLDSIISPFLGNDVLRPIMGTIHFDKNGITATNAHILITLPYPNEKYEGSYDINRIKKEKSSELLLVDFTYPKYENVIPLSENAKYVYKIDVYKLLQYAQTAINYSNKVTYQAVFKFGDNEKIGFKLNFLQIILKTWLKLGHEEIYVSMTMPNRAAVFSPSKNYEVGKDEIILLMPTMVGYGMNTKEEDIHFGAMDIDYGRHLKAYYDFTDGEIHNADGSIANFKMQYSNNLGISEDYLALLQKMTSKSRTLAILNYVKVVDGKMYATDLKTSLIVKNVDLKDGIYEIVNKAPNITMYPIEDFPKERVFNENEFQTIGNVFNGPNETPGEKRYSSFQFKISSEAFEFYLDKLLLSVGKDDLRPTMMGVCIHKTAENKIFLVSTDSNTLCKIDITEYCTFKKDDRKLEYIMSISYFKEAFDLIEGDITVKCSYSNVFIESENLDIISKNEDGKYPNYEAVIPYRNSNVIKFKHAEISKCLKEKPTLDFVNKYKSEKGKAFYITNSGEKIFLVLASESYGSSNVSTIFDKLELCSIDLQYTEENTTVSFDDSLFLMMPMRLAAFENQYFAFKKSHFEIMLKTITDTEITCYYSEVFKPYLFPIEEVKFNKTLPEEKTKFQKDNVIVDKNIKPKTASGVGVATTEKTRGAEAVVLEPQNTNEEIESTIEAINLILPSLRGKEKTEAKDTIVALYLLMGKDYETEQKISALKEKLSTLKDKLHDAKVESNQKFSNLGWGAGMRKSKLNVSTKKEDSIQSRINKIEDELKSLQNSSSFEKGGILTDAEKTELYQEWNDLVNMSSSELQNYYDSEEGKNSGLSAAEAKKLSIKSGRESARWIIKMKNISPSSWTSEMWQWAKRQVSFIKRMKGVKGDLYSYNNQKTRKHKALLIWGHNPEKYAKGGLINKEYNLEFKQIETPLN